MTPISPISRTGGFTLVEILVVIVILGLVAGLSIALVEPGERDASAREARSFAGALEYAAACAQWRNEMLGAFRQIGDLNRFAGLGGLLDRGDALRRFQPLRR